jgi:plasmid stability protein
MKTLTVRNVPDDLYRSLSSLAARNRRSLQQQVLVVLERVRALDQPSPLRRATEWRKRLQGRDLGDTVLEVFEERHR